MNKDCIDNNYKEEMLPLTIRIMLLFKFIVLKLIKRPRGLLANFR